MKVKYVFCNEEVEVDVSDEWGQMLSKLDREENLNDRRETRRHSSLSLFNADDPHFISDVDVPAQAIRNIAVEQMQDAIKRLSPRDQYLIDQVYFRDCTLSDIARKEGKTVSSILYAANRAFRHLHYKLLKR